MNILWEKKKKKPMDVGTVHPFKVTAWKLKIINVVGIFTNAKPNFLFLFQLSSIQLTCRQMHYALKTLQHVMWTVSPTWYGACSEREFPLSIGWVVVSSLGTFWVGNNDSMSAYLEWLFIKELDFPFFKYNPYEFSHINPYFAST